MIGRWLCRLGIHRREIIRIYGGGFDGIDADYGPCSRCGR